MKTKQKKKNTFYCDNNALINVLRGAAPKSRLYGHYFIAYLHSKCLTGSLNANVLLHFRIY